MFFSARFTIALRERRSSLRHPRSAMPNWNWKSKNLVGKVILSLTSTRIWATSIAARKSKHHISEALRKSHVRCTDNMQQFLHPYQRTHGAFSQRLLRMHLFLVLQKSFVPHFITAQETKAWKYSELDCVSVSKHHDLNLEESSLQCIR